MINKRRDNTQLISDAMTIKLFTHIYKMAIIFFLLKTFQEIRYFPEKNYKRTCLGDSFMKTQQRDDQKKDESISRRKIAFDLKSRLSRYLQIVFTSRKKLFSVLDRPQVIKFFLTGNLNKIWRLLSMSSKRFNQSINIISTQAV